MPSVGEVADARLRDVFGDEDRMGWRQVHLLCELGGPVERKWSACWFPRSIAYWPQNEVVFAAAIVNGALLAHTWDA